MNFEELWIEREGDFILISLEVKSEMQKTAAERLGFGKKNFDRDLKPR